jgi:16S rRNA (adenine1518-N6/adenine1519-N6)-dimethyltransferase
MALKGAAKRRAYGQHFLRDLGIIDLTIDRALKEARAHGCRALLEIGPGQGALTLPLLERKPAEMPLRLAEMDRRIAAEWTEKGMEVWIGDFARARKKDFLHETPLCVVSNLPYSSGTAILNLLAEHPDRIPAMVLMFQKEVAQKILCEPGERACGSLTLHIRNRWDTELLCDAPPRAFLPPPKVDSQVVVLRSRAEPRIPASSRNPELLEMLVKAAFAHRRKMLRGNLGSRFAGALERSGIDPTLRAEALTWEHWGKLFNAALEGASQ